MSVTHYFSLNFPQRLPAQTNANQPQWHFSCIIHGFPVPQILIGLPLPASSPQHDPRHIKTLQAIHDEAIDAIITINELGIIATVNPAACTMFQYDVDELIGQNVNILMPAPYHAAHDGYLKNYRDSDVKKIIGIGREVVGKRKDDSTFPIHLAVNEIRVGEDRLFAGVIRNLTEFRRLEEQETTLGRIIEESLNEIYIFDAQTLRFVQVNRGARENLGYDIDTIRTMTPLDIKPTYTAESFRATIEPLASGQVKQVEFVTRHRRRDGTDYDVEVYLQKSGYQNRPVYVAIILDVTQRRKMEREVQLKREAIHEELEQLVKTRTSELEAAQADLVRSEKYATLGKVSGGIAHEIRNPLNAVKTSAYYLLNARDPSPEKVREHLERIDRQVSMIDNVVTALSDVAKLPDADLTAVNLTTVLQEAIRSVDVPPNIEIAFNLPDTLPDVMADPNQIVIAFKNLIRNARDAMTDGGTLGIDFTDSDDCLTFRISDTGTGISASNLQMILEPLYTTKARGMGLGLSITRTIVEKNKGVLEIESTPGSGSCFSIALKKQPRDGTHGTSSQKRPPQRPCQL